MPSPRYILWFLSLAVLFVGVPLYAQMVDRSTRADDNVGGTDTTAFVPLLEYVEDSDNTSFGDTELSNTPGTKIDSLVHAGTTGLNYCNDLSIHSGSFRVTLDLGDDYNYGTTVFTVTVSLKIEGVDTDAGDTVLITLNPVPLSINRDAPERTYYIEFSGADLGKHDDVDIYRIYVNSYSVSGGVGSAVRVTARYDDEFSVNPLLPSPDEGKPIVYLQNIEGYIPGPHTQNPVQFHWRVLSTCADRFPAYQLQVLRLFNIDTAYVDNPYTMKAIVNWKEALTIDVAGVDDQLQTAKVTIPQGTGWYTWRVRPIGSLYEGGSADARNWGVWSTCHPDGDTLIATNLFGNSIPADTNTFLYTQFEDTLAWVYSRAFAEGEEGVGSRVAEGMTFLSPAGRPVQSQVRVAEDGTYLTANSVVDFQGRGTLGGMAAPTGNSSEGFRFRHDLFNVNATDPYTAENFDDDANWDDPDPVSETVGSASKYYNGSTTESGSQVPDAENYPFSRTILTNDGSGRVREGGGVGESYRIGGTAGGRDRTTKIYYASASDRELVRLFGDEAPLDTAVTKVLTIGPNKVTSVSWIAEGHVIATALQTSMGDTLLVALADTNEPVLSGEIVDTLRGNRTRGRLGAATQKRYAFTDSTAVTIHYQLNPDSISVEGNCFDTCATCDYLVRLYIYNVELPDSTIVLEHRLGADPCGEADEIDTSIVVTLPAGTYVIERRFEIGIIDTATIDNLNPYGVTYAEQFRELVGSAMRDSIFDDDSLAIVMNHLDNADFESLFTYLGVDPDTIEKGDTYTITTECCQVTFPILHPDCGLDPCRDTMPDFEAILFDEWGDEHGTDLNTYFKFDGDQNVWEPTPPSEPFNTLIANMLADTNESGDPLYSCKRLHAIWVGLVKGWERMKQDPDGIEAFNPDFNLLQTFLDAAGTYYIDTSRTPYDPDNGYLTWAHRYVRHDVLDDSEGCDTLTNYDVGWHGDIDSAMKWQEIRACWEGKKRQNLNFRLQQLGVGCDLSDTLNGIPSGEMDWDTMSVAHQQDSCMTWSARQIEDTCRSVCETQRTAFAWAIFRAYSDSGSPISYGEALCAADAIVDSCTGDCDLTVFGSNPIDSVGTPAEWAGIERVMTWSVETSVPLVDSLDQPYCAEGSMALAEERTVPYEDLIVEYLNGRLQNYWAANGGTYWTKFMDVLREVAPDSIVNRITDSLIFVPPFSSGAVPPRFELRNGCELWYVADTLFWSDLNPSEEHPMVGKLNSFLDAFWGMEVDSSVDGRIADCYLNTSNQLVREYDARTATDDLFLQFVETPVSFVGGEVESHDVDYFISFPSQYERGILYSLSGGSIYETSLRLFGQVTLNGTGGNTDELVLKSDNYCEDLYPEDETYTKITSIVKTAACNDTLIYAVLADDFGTTPPPSDISAIFGRLPSDPDDLTNLDYALNQSYTTFGGYFFQDSAGYLSYVNLHWGELAGTRDTCRMFGLRFFGDPTRKLSDSICGLKACPDICWHWVEPEEDTTEAERVGAPPCEESAATRMRSAIHGDVNRCVEDAVADLKRQYENKCANPDSLNEEITVSYPVDYIHFSLFYYDRAGRLVRTIPPKGVNLLGPSATRMDVTSHTFATEYDYNAFGQLIYTKSPDGGQSHFWYDRIGRLRFSQNARLIARNEYAYTKFDDLGRVVEFGVSDDSITVHAFAAEHNIEDPDFPPSGTERTYIAYDTSSGVNYLDGSPQRFLRNRVSRTWTDDTTITHFSYDEHGAVEWVGQEIPGFPRVNYTKYDYDLISGNVNEVIYNEDRADEFRHRYTYDSDNALVQVETSRDGVVWDTDVRYEYYGHGGLRRVELGEDKLQGLDYTYTIDGQLKAINHPSLDLADDPGEDGDNTYGHEAFAADSFAIMLHYNPDDYSALAKGWAFTPNGGTDALSPAPQYDGNIAGMEVNVGKTTTGNKYEERTGESYRYDHLGRLDSSRFHTWDTGTDDWNDFTDEYLTTYEYDPNGNIKLLERRGYDQGGLTKMDSITYHYQGGDSNKLDYANDAVAGDPYSEDIGNTQSANNYEYDEVGNLIADNDEGGMTMEWDAYGKVKEVDRSIVSPVAAQTIDYTYDAGGNRVRKTVRTITGPGLGDLDETFYVHDAGGVVVAIYKKSCDDDAIAPPGPIGGPNDPDLDGWPNALDNCDNTANPDQRDSDGDLRGDACDNCICTMNPSQQNNDGDALGNHCDPAPNNPLVPPVAPTDHDGDGVSNTHDNCPCTYNASQTDSDGDDYGDTCDACSFHLVELPIYGLGRVGVAMPNIDITNDAPPDTVYTRYLNQKFYELTDHLGNVRAVLGDRKRTATPGAGNYYAEFRSYSHPYPFGMPQPGRTWDSAVAYRYGFNGMETDPEVKEASRLHYTTYFRQYDPRLGRWWSNDPVVQQGESPYAAMFNNPILFSDPFGNDPPPGDAKDYKPGIMYPDDKDPDKSWHILIKDDGTQVWNDTRNLEITATRIRIENSNLPPTVSGEGQVFWNWAKSHNIGASALNSMTREQVDFIVAMEGYSSSPRRTVPQNRWERHGHDQYRNCAQCWDEIDNIIEEEFQEDLNNPLHTWSRNVRDDLAHSDGILDNFKDDLLGEFFWRVDELNVAVHGVHLGTGEEATEKERNRADREFISNMISSGRGKKGGKVSSLKTVRMTQWGWKGSKAWRSSVSKVRSGGTIESLADKVPTHREALDLINDAKGTVIRTEEPHAAPNPHQYPHINYETATGKKGTIRIQKIEEDL